MQMSSNKELRSLTLGSTHVKSSTSDLGLNNFFQDQAFEFVKVKMTDDSYTDLDRAELKQTVLESLLVGT